ncbi:MAG TPA: hypothetical protein VME22_26585 [Solirubrobacteraceae bacterium]|nr:hypothetical protein [Solirubrobacteraceae bacterium]
MAAQDRPHLDHHSGRPRANATLDAASVEAVARRVVELMRREGASLSARRLVDAATLAAELGVERSWVYTHRDELGAIQLGAGPKPRLRFDVEAARTVLSRSISREPQALQTPVAAGSSSRRRRQRLGSSAELLPIRGSATAVEASREHS